VYTLSEHPQYKLKQTQYKIYIGFRQQQWLRERTLPVLLDAEDGNILAL
jgi:hypothetical protein